jgi:hypothetical protein
MNEYISKIAGEDLGRINETKKLRKEFQHLSKEEANYSKYV